MSANKVFSIEELLEMIFLNVPQQDLFVLQRVSKKFAFTILSSPSIQRKMLTPIADVATGICLRHYMHIVPSYPENMQLSPLIPALELRPLAWELPLKLDEDTGHTIGWQGNTILHVVGSWRKMVLLRKTQAFYVDHSTRRTNRVESVQVAAGRTLGDMVEALEQLKALRIEVIPGSAAVSYSETFKRRAGTM
jgi:hypothetical protein